MGVAVSTVTVRTLTCSSSITLPETETKTVPKSSGVVTPLLAGGTSWSASVRRAGPRVVSSSDVGPVIIESIRGARVPWSAGGARLCRIPKRRSWLRLLKPLLRQSLFSYRRRHMEESDRSRYIREQATDKTDSSSLTRSDPVEGTEYEPWFDRAKADALNETLPKEHRSKLFGGWTRPGGA